MIAMYDSLIGEPTKRGKHFGTPRIWVVQIRASELDHVLTYCPKGKVQLRDLGTLISEQLRKAGVTSGRIRWIATAR